MAAKYIKIISLGILAAILAIVLEQLAALVAQFVSGQEIISNYYPNLTWFLVLAVFIEEGAKFAALRYVIYEKFGVRSFSLIISSFLLGFFFGICEIAVIVFGNPEIRKLFFELNHELLGSLVSIAQIQSATALMMGSFLVSKSPKKANPAIILIFPFLIHLLYNFLVIEKSNATNFLVALVLAVSFLTSLLIWGLNRKPLD